MRTTDCIKLSATFVCIIASLLLVSVESSARGRRGRAAPHITRTGPASQGSFGRRAETYRDVAPRESQRDFDPGPPGPSRVPESYVERSNGPIDPPRNERDFSPRASDRELDRRVDPDVDRHPVPHRHRAWHRGMQLTYVDYVNLDCDETGIEEDGYTYYPCDGAWFARTYYGGEVVYTVTDPPSGY